MFEATSNSADTLLLTGSVIKIFEVAQTEFQGFKSHTERELKIRVMTWRPFRLSPQKNHQNTRGNLQNPGQHLQKKVLIFVMPMKSFLWNPQTGVNDF